MMHRKIFVAALMVVTATTMVTLVTPQASHSQGGAGDNTGPITQTAGELALPGSNYWAVVNADGTTARHRGRVSSARLATGRYEVIFLDNIRRCNYTATIGLSGFSGFSAPGEITTVGRFTDVRGVFITTNNSAGSPSDRGFHLLVSC